MAVKGISRYSKVEGNLSLARLEMQDNKSLSQRSGNSTV